MLPHSLAALQQASREGRGGQVILPHLLSHDGGSHQSNQQLPTQRQFFQDPPRAMGGIRALPRTFEAEQIRSGAPPPEIVLIDQF